MCLVTDGEYTRRVQGAAPTKPELATLIIREGSDLSWDADGENRRADPA
jgi:hypothetical protein